MNSFFSELKQWRVYRLAVSYAAAAWLILQLTIAVREPLGLPAWTLPAMIGVLMAGFSVALWIGWLQDHRTVLPDGRLIPRSRRHHFAVALISLVPSLLVAAAFLFWHRPAPADGGGAPGDAASEKSIAVLPFDSLSADTDNAYFAEGIQDEILTDLAKVADLKVISRTSMLAYRAGGARNLREIGRALGVSHVLEGSVQRARGRVRVTAQLIDARTDLHVWADRYDGDLADIFAIQSHMAEQIVGSLKARLSPDEKNAIAARPTQDQEAYDLYLQAKDLFNEFQAQGDYRTPLSKALRCLDDALQRDSQFALAYCMEAQVHDQLYWLGYDHTTARLAQEEAAVSEALRLQPDLGEAHLARAVLLFHGWRDFAGARDELAIARKALPNSPRVLAVTAYIDRRQGLWPEAVRNLEKAVSLDPRNANFLNDLAITYDIMRLYRQEERAADAAAAALPQQAPFFEMLKAQVALESGQPEKCHAMLAKLPADFDADGGVTYTQILSLRYQRQFTAAADLLATRKGEAFANLGGDREPRAWIEGLIARDTGDQKRAEAAMLAARTVVEDGARGQPEEAATLALLGRIDAALGRKEDAWREGRRAVELSPVSADTISGSAAASSLAMIYAWTGETEQAIQMLGPLSTQPGGPHYGELRLDPAWDTLRSNPRFEQLVAAMPK